MSHLKAYCLYHNDQAITNFCKDKNCLMPLCPTCIREHTQYHQDLKTKPAYFSIYQTVTEVKELVYAAITQLEQDNAKRAEILKRIDNWNNFVIQSVSKAKEMVFGWVEQEFSIMEKEIYKHFLQKHEQLGVFSIPKTEKMESQLNNITSQLYDLYDSLKTQKFLGSVIVFLEESQNKAQSIHTKFNSFQQINENYTPRLQINKGFKRQFSSCLSKMFRIDTNNNNERETRTEDRSKSPRFLGKSRLGNGDEKIQKLQRSYTPQKSLAYLKNAPQSSRIGFTNNLAYANRIYKQQSPQRIFAYSPSTAKNEVLSPSPYQNQPRRSIYRNQR